MQVKRIKVCRGYADSMLKLCRKYAYITYTYHISEISAILLRLFIIISDTCYHNLRIAIVRLIRLFVDRKKSLRIFANFNIG